MRKILFYLRYISYGWGGVGVRFQTLGETIAIFGPGPVGVNGQPLTSAQIVKEHPNTIIDIMKNMFTFLYFVI